MYQIKKAVYKPQDIQEHRHVSLLQDIANTIQQNGRTIHIYKVKSHIGIIGNERADSYATSVASASAALTPYDLTVTDCSNNRNQEQWIYALPRALPMPSINSQTLPTHAAKPLPDINKSLKSRCHHLHRLGLANKTTTYFSAAASISPLTLPVSHSFMTSTIVSGREVTNALKLRSGNLYTQKLAKRYNLSPTSKCPLCNEEDGGYHVASGCSALTDMYIARHHAAGTYILKAIRAGELGATVIQSDIGSKNKHSKEGLPALPRNIPLNKLPERLQDVLTQAKTSQETTSIPDITLLDKVIKRGFEWHRLTLVEIKYCNDTNPAAQRERAQQQHARLLSQINNSDTFTTARLIVILLGAAGYIYSTDTQQPLTNLGITGPTLKTLLRNLHLQSIKSLTQIIKVRRHNEHKIKHKRLKTYYKQANPATQINTRRPRTAKSTHQNKPPKPRKPPDPT